MNMHRLIGTVVIVALAGCGRLAGSDYEGQPLAVLRGQVVTEAALEPSQRVGLALVWYTSAALTLDAAPAFLAQEVRVSAPFPAAFTLEVNDPPPAAARQSSPSGGYGAIGKVVAYSDDNGNGHLDLPASIGAVMGDRILGTLAGRSVIFMGGTPGGYRPGFSYLIAPELDEIRAQMLACFDGYDGDAAKFDACLRFFDSPYEDIGTPITVTLQPAGDPEAACYGLTGTEYASTYKCEVSCDPDNRGFTVTPLAPADAMPGSLQQACFDTVSGYSYRLPDGTPIPPSPYPCLW